MGDITSKYLKLYFNPHERTRKGTEKANQEVIALKNVVSNLQKSKEEKRLSLFKLVIIELQFGCLKLVS